MTLDETLAALTAASAVMTAHVGERWGVSVRTASGSRVERTFTIGSPGFVDGVNRSKVVLQCHDKILIDLVRGITNPQTAFLSGEVSLTGDVRSAEVISEVIDRVALKDRL